MRKKKKEARETKIRKDKARGERRGEMATVRLCSANCNLARLKKLWPNVCLPTASVPRAVQAKSNFQY